MKNATTIRDLVIPVDRYPHLNEGQTLQEAIEAFQSFETDRTEPLHYTMVFVLNDRNQLVGRLFLMDIMRGFAPRLLKSGKLGGFDGKEGEYADLAFLHEESTFAECGKNRHKLIKPLCHPIDFFIPADTHILKALVMMSNRNDYNVPVKDNGTIIGVLRLEEIFLAMCSTFCALP
jgi:hypothetical protein